MSRVGVFMPCYDMGPFLNESLGSLEAQTFRDFHVVVADDASPDPGTVEALQAIDRPWCRVVFEPRNLGLVALANKHMAAIDAEYIILFSPDDRMAPDFLAEQVAYLDAHPEVAAVCTWIQSFDGSDAVIEYSDDLCTLPHMLVDNHFSGAALMRKSAWLAAGMHDLDPELYPNLDYDLWLSMLSKGMTLGTIPKALFFWRVVSTSLSHDVSVERIRGFRHALVRKYGSLYAKHARFVIDHQIDALARFEEYYHQAEEGHAWLDGQYHSLSAEVERLSHENEELRVAAAAPRPSAVARVRRRLARMVRHRSAD